MKFEGIDFNEKFWKGKPLEEFLEHEKHHGLSEEKLKEVFELMNPGEEDDKESEDFG